MAVRDERRFTLARALTGLDAETRRLWRSTFIDVAIAELADAWIDRLGCGTERALDLARKHVEWELRGGCADAALVNRLQVIVDIEARHGIDPFEVRSWDVE